MKEKDLENIKYSIGIAKQSQVNNIWVPVDSVALERLLDDYNKIVEENNRLQDKNFKIISEDFHKYLGKQLEKEYISKAKIEDKIKELDKLMTHPFSAKSDWVVSAQIDILKELLKEETDE